MVDIPSSAATPFSYSWLVARSLITKDLRGAFIEGEPGVGVNDKAVHALEARLSLASDDVMSSQYPERQPVELTVTLKNGRIFRATSDFGLGSPQLRMSSELHSAKLLELTDGNIDWIEPIVRRMIGDQE